MSLPKCPKTGKKSFLTEADATVFEEKNRAEYGGLRQFPYACEDCDAWHLTSTPPGTSSIAQTKYNNPPGSRKGIETEEVVRLKESGMSVQQIADDYKVSLAAVKYHLAKAAGKLTTKTDRPATRQLVTYEEHRDRRIELEADLVRKRQEHQEAEALMQTEINRIKQIEGRLFEERQLKIGFGPNGVVILQKYNRQFDLTAEEVKKFLAEFSVGAAA